MSFVVPEVKVRKRPGNPHTSKVSCLYYSTVKEMCWGFSFHCVANEVDSGDSGHLHMKVSVLL